MKTIIAGSRDNVTFENVEDAIELSAIPITEVVSGTARGADRHGERWARFNNVPVKSFPAEWRNQDGSTNKAAGHQRNRKMAEYAEALIAVWDGKSPGTKGMIDIANRKGLTVYVHQV